MTEYDKQPSEGLSDETLEDVAGGQVVAYDERDAVKCPGGMPLYRKRKRIRCSECQYYHQTPTHWCARIEKYGR